MGKGSTKKRPKVGSTASDGSGSSVSRNNEESKYEKAQAARTLKLIKSNLDFELTYDYVRQLKNMMRQAMILRDDEQEEMIYHVLQRVESLIGSEKTRLRRRPNRATRYARGIKRIVSMTKLLINYLPNEADAFPTYGMILVHYLDIILDSSWKDKTGTKDIADSQYGYLKFMFDGDYEYVLDVVLTSIADIVAVERDSIAYHLFKNIVQDVYLYSEKSSTFAKYCAIVGIFADLNVNQGLGKEFVMKTIQACNRMPADFEEYVKDTYGFISANRFSVTALAEKLDRRKVMNNSRRRLFIIAYKEKKKVGNKSNRTSSPANSQDTQSSQGSSCFFLDTHGDQTDTIPDLDYSSLRDDPINEEDGVDFSSFCDARIDEEDGAVDSSSPRDVRADEENEELCSNEAILDHDESSNEDGSSSLMSLHSENDSNSEDNDNADEENNGENMGNKDDISDTEDFANKLLTIDDLYDRRDLISSTTAFTDIPEVAMKPSPPAMQVASTPLPADDSDIEVLMEDIVENQREDEIDPYEAEGEKDEADPESGESDVPVYDSSHIMRPRGYESSDEEDNKLKKPQPVQPEITVPDVPPKRQKKIVEEEEPNDSQSRVTRGRSKPKKEAQEDSVSLSNKRRCRSESAQLELTVSDVPPKRQKKIVEVEESNDSQSQPRVTRSRGRPKKEAQEDSVSLSNKTRSRSNKSTPNPNNQSRFSSRTLRRK